MAVGVHTMLAFFVCAGVASADRIPAFDEFASAIGRGYLAASPEYNNRRAVYEGNVATAKLQNENPQRLWTAGTNEFWDWLPSEMTSLLGWSGDARPGQNFGGSRAQPIRKAFLQGNDDKANQTLPSSKSWAHLKTFAEIRNQGACGSCWAVAAATTLQAATEVHGELRTFSAQELVDCVPNPQECGGQGGCRGATIELAMDWVMKHPSTEEYKTPYFGVQKKCTNLVALAAPLGGKPFGMMGWEMLPQNKYEPLMRSLAENGPTGVSVDASPWHMYSKGIFNGCPVNAIINHAVTAIGYGFEGETKFFQIQNSWGSGWGEGGRIRLLRKDDDDKAWCGVDNKPEQGSGCKGGPATVPVCGMCGVLFDSVMVHMK